MRSWTTLTLPTVLVSGCVVGDYCDIASELYFGSDQTVEWLVENDRDLLEGIVIHNETTTRICRG